MPPNPLRLLRTAALRARARREPPVVVLAYHRVAAVPSDPQLLCVAPERFAQQMAVLEGHYRPLRFEDLHLYAALGHAAERTVLVTFDDGYADNLQAAAPLLEKFDVPATVFVTSGSVDSPSEFWWDELERLLLLPGQLPGTLRVRVRERAREWELGRASVWSEDDAARHRGWNVLAADTPTPRHAAYRELHRWLKPLPTPARAEALASIRAQAGADVEGRGTHRALTREELRDLAGRPGVTIGAHTMTHPRLSSLAPEEQRREIGGSRQALAEILGEPPPAFAYPYGAAGDFGPASVAAVRDAGFDAAFTTAAEPAWPGGDSMRLPRFLVRDWDGATFARALERFFRGG